MGLRPGSRRSAKVVLLAVAGVLLLLVVVGGIRTLSRPTFRDVVLGESARLAELREAFTRLDRSLPAPGSVTRRPCPAGMHYTYKAADMYFNSIDVVMRGRLSDPAKPGPDDLGRSELARMLSMSLPGYQGRSVDSDRVDEATAARIHDFLHTDTVVVVQLSDLRPGVAGPGLSFTPGSVDVEALVVVLSSGEIRCATSAVGNNHSSLEFTGSSLSGDDPAAQAAINGDLMGQAAAALAVNLGLAGVGDFAF